MTIFSDFLTDLGVKHTEWYADEQFHAMTFKSLFGLSKLMEAYGIPCEAAEVPDKSSALAALKPPYLARMADYFAIVTQVDSDNVYFRDGLQNGIRTLSRDAFCSQWTGVVFVAQPDAASEEPHYAEHRFTEIANRCKRYALVAAILFLIVFGFVCSGVWHSAGTVALVIVDIIGIYITYQLLLKTLGIHSAHGDAICSIIDRTGCHTVLGTDGAKFFGIFSWSEVGVAYFTVSLAALLAFPGCVGSLALINACCCPFSFWSVWYQRYRAKAWCTLCLITQACLWLCLGSYIWAGAFREAWPIGWPTIALGAAYVAVLFGLNAIDGMIEKK